jgi:malate dehydrogenase (oxaloacetate-decarboxylating)
MAWERKIMRTVRIRNDQTVGQLARLLSSISDAGGAIGDIDLMTETSRSVVRDITIYGEDAEHVERIVKAMAANPGTKILQVRDEVLELHQKGKIAIRSRFPVDSMATLRLVYTPGVAEVCLKIAEDPSMARLYTSTSHMVAIVTDGTAVLGLGDIGPLAGMPVMEGKAMLMESLVGLSGVPILLNTKDPDEIVAAVAAISPTFAAIQLEDISAPRCFEIEERLQKMLDIPVMHDDQHGTAVVATAALTNACRQTNTDMKKAVIGQIGLGAAGFAIAKMLMRLTGNPVYGADLSSDAIKHLEAAGGKGASLNELMEKCDIVVATTGAPGLIKPSMVRKGQIILALSNPNAEIEPDLALEHGAAFAADGKMVNNVLGFPGIFRGVVDANASHITHEMLVAAAQTIADMTPPGELVPSPLDKEVHRAVARAVATTAMAQGIARAEYVPYVEE